MPITSRMDQSEQLTTFTATDEVTFNDVIEALRPFFAGRATKNILWNFCDAKPDVADLTENLERIARFSNKEQELRSSGKTALVASADLMYGLLRMYETFADIHGLAHSVMAFRTIEGALQWINEDP